MNTEVVVDGRTWTLIRGSFFRDQKFVPWVEVPSAVRVQMIRVQHAAVTESNHDEALVVDFAVTAYIPGSNPRKFILDHHVLDCGQFTLVCAEKFGWTGNLASHYRRLNALLRDAGHQLKTSSPKAYHLTGDGDPHVPLSLKEYL